MTSEVFPEAANLYRRARYAGVTARSSVDCLIAVSCLSHDLEVYQKARDYDAPGRLVPLRVRRRST
jgi:predicted nucleic acid-binding protein